MFWGFMGEGVRGGAATIVFACLLAKNLEKVIEVGYEKWLKEKKEEVDNGFITGIVIKGMKR